VSKVFGIGARVRLASMTLPVVPVVVPVEVTPVEPPPALPPPGPPPPGPPPVVELPSYDVSEGQSLQAAINAATAGATLTVGPGTWREAITVSKQLTIVGQGASTILKGSDVVTGWEQVPLEDQWSVTWTPLGSTPATISGWTTMLAESAGTGYAEAVFVDGTEQTAVATLAACTSGKYYVGGGKLYLGSDPTGKTVEVSKRSFVLKLTADHVTLTNLAVRHCANIAQGGAAVQLNGSSYATLNNLDVAYASAAGLDIFGGYHVVNGGAVHHCGQLGVTGRGYGVTLSGAAIYANNTRGYDPAWEAGGTKFHQGGADPSNPPWQGVTITGCTVYENVGPGLWVDVWGNGYLIDACTVYSNGWQGINVELSKNVEVKNCKVYRNGHGIANAPHGRVEPPQWGLGAGIYVLACDNVNVHDNICAWNADGITVWQDARWTPMETVSVDDNTIIQHAASGDAYAIAYLESGGGSIAVTVGGSRNVIYGASGVYYNWLGDGASRTTIRATMATTRGDWTGTSLTLTEAQAVCAANGIPTTP
jgi:hypothetical protein